MIQARMRLPGFCMRRAMARVRVPSPARQYNQTSNSIILTNDTTEFSSNSIDMINFNNQTMKTEYSANGNRVMVVVDSSLEANGALQWALSHTVQSQDTIILLHVINPSKQGVNCNRQRAYELLCSMKNMCQMKRPGVHVEIALLEGKEKGPTIVEEAKQQRVSLLVLGQRKRSMIWRLRTMWAGKRNHSRVVEYCIQNANCMTIAVRRKSRKYGGYLITTKRHKDFWLLA
uniref:UspA domain-containing protein n=1 Tax=Davidia involucrata TaxID=16924 RepID=A0A5B7BPV6_DAVIN